MQYIEVPIFGKLLDLHEKLPGDTIDPLVNLDLAVLSVPISSMIDNKHPFEDGINPSIIRVGLLQPLYLNSQAERPGDYSVEKAHHLWILDGLRGEIVLDDDRGEVDLATRS